MSRPRLERRNTKMPGNHKDGIGKFACFVQATAQ
jgi:hypothetical protein